MGWETVAAVGLGIGGQILGGRQQSRDARRQNARADAVMGQAQGMMQHGPDQYQAMLNNLILGGSPAFNASQDAITQYLRSDPLRQTTAVDDALRASLGGTAFDNTNLFSALDALNQRDLSRSIADLRGSQPSLGARFSTGTRMAESELRANALTQFAAQRAGLQAQSYEADQARRLQAASLLSGREQAATQNMFQAAGQGAAFQQLLASMIGQSAGLAQNNRALNAQLLGIGAGVPFAPGPNYAQMGTDIASLLLLPQLLRR